MHVARIWMRERFDPHARAADQDQGGQARREQRPVPRPVAHGLLVRHGHQHHPERRELDDLGGEANLVRALQAEVDIEEVAENRRHQQRRRAQSPPTPSDGDSERQERDAIEKEQDRRERIGGEVLWNQRQMENAGHRHQHARDLHGARLRAMRSTSAHGEDRER